MRSHHDAAAIAGIGATEFSKASGRTELQLALEASKAALDDAGIAPHEVDGFVSYSMDTSPSIEVARGLGCENVSYFGLVDYGGGAACATIMHAAMAVATERPRPSSATGPSTNAPVPVSEPLWTSVRGASTPARRTMPGICRTV